MSSSVRHRWSIVPCLRSGRALAVAAVLASPGVRAEDAADAARDVVVMPPAASGIALPAPKDLGAAVSAIERATGAKAEPIVTEGGVKIPVEEGRGFALDARTAERLVAGSHAAFREAGVYLFRSERSYGLPGELDRVVVLNTGDLAVALRRMGTAGHRHGVTNAQIVAWLEALAREEPLEVLEIGSDFVAGRFVREPKDPVALAHRAAIFAPDLVAGHSDPTAGLADLMGRRRTLFLIWD
jgi:Domain of unknown function (DUF4253)